MVRALRQAGWQAIRQRGSHVQLRHPDRPGLVTVPIHRGKTLKRGDLQSILHQAGLTADQLADLL